MASLQQAQLKNHVAFMVPEASKARVEIEEFIGDNEMTNLYLLALEAMQKEDVTKSAAQGNEDWWTFYSLSGIHGQPSENWNGVRNPNGVTGSYCTHGELVFPTWHRVYINMFEQAVSNKIQAIAAQFTAEPQKSLYRNAADRFRLPFWDPFLPRNPITTPLRRSVWGYPKILTTPQVWVTRPGSAKLELTANPLYAFNFPNSALSQKGRTSIRWNSIRGNPPQGRNYTVRAPDSNGETSIPQLEANLRAQIPSLGTTLWKLLSRYTDPNVDSDNNLRTWASFSTHNQIDPTTDQPILDSRGDTLPSDTTVSLESWHDNIHGLIATGNRYSGHMGNPAIAGFDPIFWLHHCNIDRILAIYQAMYPDKWMRTRTASANLYPFHKDDIAFWNSGDVQDWRTLGYAIPGNKTLNAAGQTALETHLNEYYNWVVDGSSTPPASVAASWPRDLSTSVALNGAQARRTTPVVRFEAMDASSLITRTVSVQAQDTSSTKSARPPTDSDEGQVVLAQEAVKINIQDVPKNITISDAAANTTANPPETVKSGSTLTWNARVRVKKFAYDGSFNIHLFIGDIKEAQPERFITRKNEVGLSTVFATTEDAPCATCKKQRDEGMIYEDTIPISHALYAYLRSNTAPETEGPSLALRTLESFEPDQVKDFLKNNLKWVLTDMSSNLLGDVQMMIDSGLEIGVSARKFDLPTQEFPLGVYYPPVRYEEITRDKVGGLGYVNAPAS